MNAATTVSVWRCPACRGELLAGIDRLVCVACSAGYRTLGGIPDFRLNLPHWIDVGLDRRNAERLLALSESMPAVELAADVFRQRPGWAEGDVKRRTRQTFELGKRLERELDEWLREPTSGELPFLDLGCGSGPLLTAATIKRRVAVGIDVSLEWLVVARKRILEQGGTPLLAAGLGESLPFADASFAGVISLDVIEHVGHQPRFLREIARVMAPGGIVALSTPNRYSLTAEPHVSVWGVGWLPRSAQGRYVRWRTGKSYAYNRLLGVLELRRLLRASGFTPRLLLARVPDDEIRKFHRLKALLARVYNRLLAFPPARGTVLLVCPFFRVLARKRDGNGANDPSSSSA